MKRWRRGVSLLTREEIMSAVDDDSWQRFRRTLKGLSTTDKLEHLDGYLKRREELGRLERVHVVRVDNYINALLRGGQLKYTAEGLVVRR